MRAELAQIHQETLETRLATEELWAQMAGDSPAAALVESLARTRAKLAEHYRALQEEIQQKKNELLAIRAEMTHEHRRLVKRKHHFDQWAQRCQQENEEMAKRLAAKEREINRREAQMADEVHAWEIERIEYQQAIRQLMSRLPEREGAAV
jgi:gas vesicle protein